MNKIDLKEIFHNLTCPGISDSQSEVFNSTSLVGFAGFHLGKDLLGRPALILGGNLYRNLSIPRFNLENLSIESNIECNLINSEGIKKPQKFTLIKCLSQEQELHTYFLQIIEIVLSNIQINPSVNLLISSLNKVVELFHFITRPSNKSLIGLWAELFVILESNNPLFMVQAWHDDNRETFDFSYQDLRIEVKCSSDGTRNHFFTFDQVNPSQQNVGLVASIFTESVQNGVSLADLWERVRKLTDNHLDLQLKVENICMQIMGNEWNRSHQIQIDYKNARKSLSFFDIAQIPKINGEIPRGVSDIRFRSNLDLVDPIDRIEYRNRGILFEACL